MAKIKADRRLYLTADRRTVVEHGDLGARYLLVGEGGEIPIPEAERLGLAVVDGRVVQGAVEEKADEPEGPETGEAEEGDESDGWPDGYSWERAGAYYQVTAPDGSMVESDTPSGKWNGEDAAQEAAWRHARDG